MNDISPDLHDEPLVKEVSNQLAGVEKLVSFPPTKAPSADEVRKVNQAVGRIMDEIQSKDAK
jgi:HAMP domain-containing protein